ncbi:hypothetical protein [Levilactobacillus sp. 244-2]|uniref:hypothetical protein n=1 Tax=Levilactobacillus sp. 244-2 TaxID=2799569 RepID=UPI00194DC896|nr:hypothetical protein [Levilactobacillus sp. 244-2]
MADSSRTIMTDAGFALETRVRADETKMQFTRAAISTDDHFSDTDDALAKLTELSNIQQDGKVTAVQVINTTTVYVQVDVNQAESKADYQMRSAALYAKDDDGTEVLYGVTVLQDPVFVHKDADGSYLGFGINTTVGKASNVVVVVDPANMVTQQVFEGTMKNYYTKAEVDAKFVTDDDFASKLPKNIATTDAANTFAKSQTLAGGATDGAGNAIATTKDVSDGDATTLKSAKDYADTKISGKADDSKVVHTADMRKPASDVAGIEEVNAKQDKIGYTPADDSKVVHNSAIDQSPMVKRVLSADDDVLTLDPGTYWVWGKPAPKNYPTDAIPWGRVVVKMLSPDGLPNGTNVDNKIVEVSDTNSNRVINISQGWPLSWSGWQVPNSDTMASKSDVTTAVSAVNANMVHRNPDTGVVSEPTDFTNLTVNGGKSVATSDDLKSVEDASWRELNFDVSQGNYKAFSAAKIVYKINRDEKYISFFFAGTPSHVGNVANNSTLVTDTTSLVMDLSSVLTEISGINFKTEYGQISDSISHAASLGYAGAKVVFTSQVFISNDLVGVTFLPKDYPDCRIYYTSLVNGI